MRVMLDVVRGRESPCTLDIQAGSLAEARTRAEHDGYQVLDCRVTGSLGSGWRLNVSSTRRLNRTALNVFIEQLQALLAAGLSVVEALNTLQRSGDRALETQLGQLVGHLRAGLRLSQALSMQTDFPPLLVALVRSAELTSDLPEALGRYLEHEKRSAEVRHKLTSVAVYPLLLTAVGGAVVLFLLFYVMPRFAKVFEELPGPLPWSAEAMVRWSHLLHHQGPLIFAMLAALLSGLCSAWFIPELRAGLLNGLLAWPTVQRRMRTYFLTRWYRTTGMLVLGGIPLPESVRLASMVLPGSMQEAGRAVETGMRAGLAPSHAYANANMATPVAEQLLRAGERSGEVGHFLERVAQFHEAEVTRTLENAMRALEPIVMALIGVGVGAIVILMYMPIFELASAIQ